MKLATEKRQHESSHSGNERQAMLIKAGAKAFDTLLDGMYTNKIRAIVREICTNAADSHAEAGCESMPFDVHLPTYTDPRFIVRDYGVGMDHETVMGVFSTLFDSSKDETDDLVGGFGLGSKTPFSITDSYEVICRDGVARRVYHVYKDENGIPMVEKIGQVDDDGARGVEVAVPVQEHQFDDFLAEANNVFFGFSPVPNIDADITLPTPKFFYEAANDSELSYMLLDPYTLNGSETVWIRQGCVLYPVDRSLPTSLRDMLANNSKIVVDVPIGTATPTANREALQLGDTDAANLSAVFDGLAEQVKKEVYEAVDKEATTMLEAQAWWFGGGIKAQSMNNLFSFQARWKGKQVTTHIDIRDLLPKAADGSEQLLHVKVAKNRKLEPITTIPFHQRGNYIFVYHPVGEKVMRATKRYAQFCDEKMTRWGEEKVYHLGEIDPKVMRELQARIGGTPDQFVSLAKITDPGAPTAAQREAGKIAGAYVCGSSYGSYSKLTKGDKPSKGECYWRTIDRTTSYNAHSFYREYNEAISNGLVEPRMVIQLTYAAQERLKLDAADHLHTAIKNGVLAKKAEYVENYFKYLYNDKMRRCNVVGVGDALDHITNLYQGVPDPSSYLHHLTADDKAQAEQRCAKLVAELRNKYPLLFGKVDKTAVQWYIDTRDKELQTNRKDSKLP